MRESPFKLQSACRGLMNLQSMIDGRVTRGWTIDKGVSGEWWMRCLIHVVDPQKELIPLHEFPC